MKIRAKEVTIRDVFQGFTNNDEEGVVGYDGLLNIRPKYQREFVYNPSQQKEVINTINNNFPLSIIYWAKNQDGTYEVLDGQQRTISFCNYVNGVFAVNNRYFSNLTKEEQDAILDYKLLVYECEGTDKDKLEWFKVINIAGVELTQQELRNAVYTGEWLTDAKRYFSKTGCPAYQVAGDYMKGVPIRQDYLETVLKWISNRDDVTIEDYMARHQHDKDAEELWFYFREVISWVERVFPEYRKEMKGLDWGIFYNEYGSGSYNPRELEEKIKILLIDDDVTKKSGVYHYLLSGNEKHLNIRNFTAKMKREAYEKQDGICNLCDKEFSIKEMEADHITPWSEGGKTEAGNLQMLCRSCNRSKSNK